MPHEQGHIAGGTDPQFGRPKFQITPKEQCQLDGGTWDEQSQTCIPKGSVKAPGGTIQKLELPKPEEPDTVTIRDKTVVNKDGTFTVTKGGVTETLSAEEHRTLVSLKGGGRGAPTQAVSSILDAPTQEELAAQRQAAAGQQLAGQVGQIDPSTGITPTDLSQKEAFTQGAVGAIPNAIRLAAQFGTGAALLGAGAGSVVPVIGTTIGAGAGAAIGAVTGFVAGLASGMISNMAGQRRDNTNAQQRVLDEGKQTLKDWSTLAKSDPANREFYLSQFNRQLQLIQDAHVQMLTDTNADLAKFESAVPNLAEFNTFYSIGGERDALVQDMQISLQTPSGVDFEMLALAQRRQPR